MVLSKLARRDRRNGSALRQLGEFERFFDDFFRNPLWERSAGGEWPSLGAEWVPAVDIEETDGEYRIHAEMPGMRREDVKVSLLDNVLTLSGEKRAEAEEKERRVHRTERVYGSFQRSFTLPEPIQADKVTASFKDGVLTVTVPKSEEAKPRQIEVKVN